MLQITDTVRQMEIDQTRSRDLELKLNVTSKGKIWSHIGDELYDYYKKQECSHILVVTSEQFDLLQVLQTKTSYKDCQGL